MLVAVLAQLVVLVSSAAFGFLTLAGISNGTVKPNGAPVACFSDSCSCAALEDVTCPGYDFTLPQACSVNLFRAL